MNAGDVVTVAGLGGFGVLALAGAASCARDLVAASAGGSLFDARHRRTVFAERPESDEVLSFMVGFLAVVVAMGLGFADPDAIRRPLVLVGLGTGLLLPIVVGLSMAVCGGGCTRLEEPRLLAAVRHWLTVIAAVSVVASGVAFLVDGVDLTPAASGASDQSTFVVPDALPSGLGTDVLVRGQH